LRVPSPAWVPILVFLSWSSPAAAPEAEPTWEVSGSASAYFLPDDENFTIPIVIADRGRLHLEARYNYEALETGSLWAGLNLEWGDEVTLAFTPMLGYAFGDAEGILPGFEATLSYGSFELYSEFEYFIDPDDSYENFLYNWSELSWEPGHGFRVGLTTQRTRVYDTERSIQRALLLGYSVADWSFTAHLFNPGDDDHFVVFAVGVSF